MTLSPAQWIHSHADVRPGAPAVDDATVRLTYRALADAVAALAAHLVAAGFGPGRRLLVAIPASPAAVVAIAAAHHAGGSAVPVSSDSGEDAVASVLAQTGARHAVVAAAEAARWRATLERVERLWVSPSPGAEPFDGGLPLGADGAPLQPAVGRERPRTVGADDEAYVLFTSGSTGEPRGVIQSFGNVAANTRSIIAYLGLGESDRALAILPLYYCYGLSVLQTHLSVGGSVYFEPRSLYPRVVVEIIGREGCTGFAGVPFTFELIRRHVDVPAIPLPRLRYLTQAGGAMGPETTAWTRAAFQPARLFVMYGQTEATARLAYLPPERGAEKLGAIGIAIPGVELRVVGPDGAPLPDGDVGELVARGENVTRGYLGAPEETAAIFRGGVLHTGDLAYRDPDGFFFVVGRVKEMLKIAGHRVSPVEIERVLLRHPAVLEVAVAGIPDKVQGEVAAAFVVRRDGPSAGERELRAFCRERLPAWCVPVTVRFVPSLPRSSAGKLLRHQLVAALAG